MGNRISRREIRRAEELSLEAVSQIGPDGQQIAIQPGQASVFLNGGRVANLSTNPEFDGVNQQELGTHLTYRQRTREIRAYQEDSADITRAAMEQQLNVQGRGGLAAPDQNNNRRNYETYKYDYYCGSQAKVFFGDIWVDDIIGIQYNIRQTKEPIYGYASQHYDAIAMGTILGEGNIAISFKETGYLNVIKAYMEEQAMGVNNAALNVSDRLSNGQEGQGYTTSQYAAQISPNYNPSFIRQSETIEEVMDNLKNINANDHRVHLEKTSSNNVDFASTERGDGTYTMKDFEDAAEVLEDVIWGDTNGKPFNISEDTHGLKRADEFDYIYDSSRNPIGIDVARNGYEGGFNIVLTFGDMSDHRAEHTVQVLNDVHFTGQSMMVNPGGEPIAEVYNFIFRDINKTVNSRTYNVNPVAFNIGRDDPFRVSSRADIEGALSDYKVFDMNIRVLSSFDGNQWTSMSDLIITPTDMGMPLAQLNENLGLHGTIYKYVEEAIFRHITETSNSQIDTGTSQRLAIKVDSTWSYKYHPDLASLSVEEGGIGVTEGWSRQDADGSADFNIILEQQFPGAAAYKVIAPGTNDYAALDLVRREDFFRPHPAAADSTEALTAPIPRDETTGKLVNNSGGDKGIASEVPASGITPRVDVTSTTGDNTVVSSDDAAYRAQIEAAIRQLNIARNSGGATTADIATIDLAMEDLNLALTTGEDLSIAADYASNVAADVHLSIMSDITGSIITGDYYNTDLTFSPISSSGYNPTGTEAYLNELAMNYSAFNGLSLDVPSLTNETSMNISSLTLEPFNLVPGSLFEPTLVDNTGIQGNLNEIGLPLMQDAVGNISLSTALSTGDATALSASIYDIIQGGEAGNWQSQTYAVSPADSIYGNSIVESELIRQGYLTAPISTYTLDEVIGIQGAQISITSDLRDQGIVPTISSAIGGGQFLRATLRDAINNTELTGAETFDQTTQDRITQYLIDDKRGLGDYLSGDMTLTEFATSLSQEWASVQDPTTGFSYYDIDGNHYTGAPGQIPQPAHTDVLSVLRSAGFPETYQPEVNINETFYPEGLFGPGISR